jgi:RimJ/RimL family protein N-acetyltransferase
MSQIVESHLPDSVLLNVSREIVAQIIWLCKEDHEMILKTERLILRPFRESDAEDVYEYLKEPLVNCFACMKLDSVEAPALRSWKEAGTRNTPLPSC